MSFSLAGPLGVLEPREVSTSKWTGERAVEKYDMPLDLGVPWYGDVELRNHYVWESTSGARDQIRRPGTKDIMPFAGAVSGPLTQRYTV